MKVYILIDSDHVAGYFNILGVYLDHKMAVRKLNQLKKQDAYVYQWLEIQSHTLRRPPTSSAATDRWEQELKNHLFAIKRFGKKG